MLAFNCGLLRLRESENGLRLICKTFDSKSISIYLKIAFESWNATKCMINESFWFFNWFLTFETQSGKPSEPGLLLA